MEKDCGSTRVEARVDGGSSEVTEVPVAARPVAGLRARVARGQIASEFSTYLDLVYAAARDGEVSLDGQNILICRAADADYLTVEFCVGVTAPLASIGALVPLVTPSGVTALTTHRDDYRRPPEANAAIREWCHERGRRHAGPSWEVYGHCHADPALLRTDVYYQLELAGP
jgi:GyrI-like small molecule binding domain